MVNGPVATSLGELARERWRALGDDEAPPRRASGRRPVAPDVKPDLTDVDVAHRADDAGDRDRNRAIRECEALFLDSIAAAKQDAFTSKASTSRTTSLGARARRRGLPNPTVPR